LKYGFQKIKNDVQAGNVYTISIMFLLLIDPFLGSINLGSIPVSQFHPRACGP